MKKVSFLSYGVLCILLFNIQIRVMAVCNVNITPTPSANICAGQQALLTANPGGGTGPYAFLWSTSATTQAISVTAAGTYSVTITDALLCTANKSIVVTVNPLPTPAITGSNFFCPNFSGAVYTTPLVMGNTYLWTVVGGTFVGSATNNTVTVNWGGAGNATLSVKETKTLTGCNATVSYPVLINPLPTPFVSGLLCVCVNSLGVTYATPDVAGSTYVWEVTGGTIATGQGSNQITVDWGGAAGAGQVKVTETSAATCVNSSTLNVTINAYPVAIVTVVNNNVCSGTAVNFQAPSGTGYTYLWNFGDPASGTSNNTSTLQNPSHIFKTYGCSTTNYDVSVTITTGCGGCVTTSPIQVVTIKQQPNPMLQDVDPISPFSNCDNNPTLANHDFQLTLNNVTTNGGCITGYTIDWGDGTVLPYATGFASATHLYTDLGAFDLVFTANGANGCNNSITYTVANQSVPAVGISNNGGNTAGCYPITFTFTIDGAAINSPGTTYDISYGDGATETKTNAELLINNIVSHTYTSSSCGQGIPGNQFTVSVNATNACLISVEATVNQIKIYKPPVASFTTDPANIGCVNTNVCVTNTSTPGYGFNCNQFTSWLWNFGDPGSGSNNTSTLETPPCHVYTIPGTYTITLTASNDQCPNGSIFTKTICIDPQPNSSFTVNNDIGCKPLSLDATNTSVNENTCGDLVYTWSVVFNGAGACTPSAGTWDFTNGTDLHTEDASFIFNDPGTYTITLATQNACTTVMATKIVTVKTFPKVTVAPITAICASGTVHPSATYELCYGNEPTFSWLFPGGNPTGANTLDPGEVNYSGPATYVITLNATNECGTGTNSTNIVVKPLPVATATPVNQTICSGTSSQSIVLTSTLTGTTYAWSTVSTPGTTGAATSGTASTIPAWILTNTTITDGTVTITIIPTTAGCAGEPITHVITVIPKPLVSNTPLTESVCSGDPTTEVTLTSLVTGTTFVWLATPLPASLTGYTASGSGTIPVQTITNPTTSPGTVTYSITPTANGCIGFEANYVITVKPLPSVTNTPLTKTICSGANTSVILTSGVAGATFGWSSTVTAGSVTGNTAVGIGDISDNLTNSEIILGTVQYSITPTAEGCEGPVTTFTVHVQPVANVTPSQSTQEICAGATTSAVSLTSNVLGAVYSWTPVANPVTGMSGFAATNTGNLIPVMTINSTLVVAGTVTYTITPSIGGCNGTTNTHVITVNPAPSVVPTPALQSVCSGVPTALVTLNSNVGGGVTYAWTATGSSGNVSGFTLSGTGNIPVQTLTNTGFADETVTYHIIPNFGGGTGLNCPGVPLDYLITVKPLPVATATPASQTVCSGLTSQTITLSSSIATGNSYTWSTVSSPGISGAALNGTANPIPSWTLTNLNTTAGTITITITPSANGCQGNAITHLITVNPKPLVVTSPLDETVCSGSLTAAVTLTSLVSGTTFSWTASPSPVSLTGYTASGSNMIPSQTIFNPTTSNGTVTYTITPVANTCTGTVTNYVITVKPLPNVSNTPMNKTICSGANTSVTLTSGVAGATYAWSSAVTAGTVSGNTGSGSGNILDNLTNSGIILGTVQYSITPTANNCLGPVSNYTVNVQPVASALPSQTTQDICAGAATTAVTLSSNVAGTVYSWTPIANPSSGMNGFTPANTGSTIPVMTINSTLVNTGTVTYMITPSIEGCVGTAGTHVITINPAPSVITTPMSQSICSGIPTQAVTLSSNVGTGVTYTWSATGSTVNVTGFTASGTGNIPVENLTNSGSSEETVTYHIIPNFGGGTGLNCPGVPLDYIITVKPIPFASSTPASQSVCSGIPTQPIVLSSSILSGTTYAWTSSVTNGISGAQSGGSANPIPVMTLTNPSTSQGTVTFYITPTAGGCNGAQIINEISVNPVPVITTVPSTNPTICSGDQTNIQIIPDVAGAAISYTAALTSGTVTGFLDGSNSPINQTLINTGIVPGSVTYTITCTANGCSTTKTVVVTVNPRPVLTTVPTPDQEICSGTSTNILLTSNISGASITWLPSLTNGSASGFSASSGSPISQVLVNSSNTIPAVVTYTITTISNGCTGNIINFPVTVHPLPTANAGSDQPIPYGTSTILAGISVGGTPPRNYSWTPDVSIVSGINTLSPVTTNLYSATTFTLQVTDSKGCLASDDVVISLSGNPLSVTCTALPGVICNNGASVNLNAVAAGGSGNYSYTWTSLPGSPPWSALGQSVTVNPTVNTIYTVTVNDGFNTINTNVPVTVNPLPDVFSMTGGGEYCSGGTGVPVGLSGSVTGISYQLYLGAATDGPALMGTGIALSFGNKTAAGIYTVRATDATTTCFRDMTGIATVTINPLPVVNAGADKIISNGTSTTLAGAASGGTGTLIYSWAPAPNIASGGNTLSPVTTNIYATTTFTLSVVDGKGCINTDDMQVIISGNPLAVVATIIPNEICEGEPAQLGATATGGSGTYTYAWTCSPGSPPWSSTIQNPMVSPSVTTSYSVVANDGYNSATATVSLIVNPLPEPYNVTGGGSYCFGLNGVQIGLSNSETGVTYQLFRGTTPLTPTVEGVTGLPVTFGYFTIEGTYTIRATRTLTGCQSLMTGSATVSILPLPAVFTVTGGGSYPSGGNGVVVGLSDSEIGVNYLLLLENNPVIPLPGMAGTGDEISFGYQTQAGSYTVVATNEVTGCISEMSGNVNVIINPYPSVFNVTGGGQLCFGETGKEIGLSGSEIGIRYVLLHNNDSIDQFPGTGDPLNFGLYAIAGTYTVKGVTITTGLFKMMTGNAIIIVNPLPLAYLLVPQGDTCYGTEILINGSQAGIDYSLFKGNTFISMVPGTGVYGLLSFGHIFDLGTFRVEGVNTVTGCRMDMIGTVTLHPLPLVFNVIPPGILCPGESVLLSGSEIGIEYQLMRDDVISVGPPITGTGLPLDFGPQFLPGVYRVIATNPVTLCYSWMDLNSTIEPSPIVYNILPSGNACAPAHVLLNGSQSGIEYRLVFNNAQILAVLNGTGLPLDFGIYTTAGDYQVMAINNVTHCEYWMGESLHIFAAPIQYDILPNGIACAGSIIGLDASEPGVVYTLIRDGWITVGVPVIGTGASITFGPQADPGAYTIEGKIGTTQCHSVMNGTAVLQPNPAVYMIQPSGNQCAGTEIYLSGSQVGVNYKLLRDNVFVVALNGTGTLLPFGQQFLQGVYTVEAMNATTNCQSVMDGSTTILPGPLAFDVMPVGINCTPTTIILVNSEDGIIYQLRRDHIIDVGPSLTGTSGLALNFGPQTLPGLYEVIAHNPLTDCYSWMTGGITIQPPAIAFSILPSGNTCAPALVRLNGSEIGKRYDLYLDGTFLLASLVGTGLPLEFGTFVTSGIYTIVAVDVVTLCETAMSDILTIFPSPEKFQVVPNGIACANMDIGIDDSEIGVDYTLIRDGSIIAAGPVAGTGNAIWFGIQSYPGDYTVDAVFSATNCHSVMNGTATLSLLPLVYLIEPQGDQCAGTDIYVNGSQQGIDYQLFRDNILLATLAGDGSVIHFGPQDLVGLYVVKGVNPTSLCEVLMSGSTNILAGPLAFNVTPSGANCSPAEVGLSGSQVGVNYQLYRDGFAVGGLVPGTGNALIFGLQPAGNYIVTALDVTTTCSATMQGAVVITDGPEVNAGVDAVICATHTVQLSGVATNHSTVFWTTGGDGQFSDPAILDPVYTPGPNDIINGSVSLQITAHGSTACPSVIVSDEIVIMINPFPVVDAGANVTICYTQSAALNGTTQNTSTLEWTTDGDGSFDNATVFNPIYSPGPLDKIAGQVIVRLNVHGALSCLNDIASDFLTIFIEPLPVSNAGPDATICENWDYRLSGSAIHQTSVLWTTTGDGTFDNPSLVDATYTPSANDRIVGSVQLVLTATGLATCSMETDQDVMILTLNKLPLVDVGPDVTICANQVYQASASVQRNSDIEWVTSGDGIFSDIHALNPAYTPGALDILTGSVILSLNAHGLLNCITEVVTDNLTITFYPMPVANAGTDFFSCPNVAIPLNGSATNYMSVLWSTSGDGTFNDPSLINASYTPELLDIQKGFVELVLTVNGEHQCGPQVDMDTVRIDFKPLPTVSLSGSSMICEDSTGVVVLTLGGLGPWTVVYTDGLNNFTINNIPSSPYNLNVTPIATTTYTILSVSDANCVVNHTGPAFTVTVNPQPNTYATTSTNGGGFCEGGIGVEIGIDGSQSGVFYQLLFGGQASGLALPGTGSPITFGWKSIPGVYQVKAWHPQTSCEVYFSDSVVVLVFPSPRVDFTSDSACFGQPTQFHLTGLDINKIANWQWNFGDGTIMNYAAPIEPAHLYPATGGYLVSLTVTDTNDCVKTFVHPVYVNEIPTAMFSHNAPMCSGYEVAFTDYSYAAGNNYLQQWHWDFGDNSDTTIYWPDLPDVSHVYNLAAGYAVTLTVTTNRGCTAVKIRTIDISPAPAANFSFTNACEKESVYFTDISQLQGGGAIVEWNWNFGDPLSGVNNTSLEQSPVHVFDSVKVYKVQLIVMNSGGCIDTIYKYINVLAGPKPNFTFNTACLGSVTQFTDISVPASNIEWLWDFGDGSPVSTSQNPSHIFANPGVYPVKLTVKNANFCSHDTTLSVSVIPLPTAGFQTDAPLCKGALVTFTNTSTTQHGQIVKWMWDFGDGTGDTIAAPMIPNVTHAFTGIALQHLVRLTVKTSDSCTSYVEHLIQSVSGPVASFTNSTVLCPGENVQFTDLSQQNGANPITGWHWNFNDPTSGTENISLLQNPVHAFTGPGQFNVKLIIINNGSCKDSLTRLITIYDLPVSNFTFDTVCLGSIMHFSDMSTTAPGSTLISWDWNFGDGQPHANVPDPAHLYATAGTFNVTLTVMNSNHCTSVKNMVVHVNPGPVAAFTNSSVNCSGSNVSFIDQSAATHGYILEWHWFFGDGHDTIVHLPAISPVNHIYAAGGTYNVVLTVKTSDSCTASSTNTVTVYNKPVANFSFSSANCAGAVVQFTDLSQQNGSGAITFWNWNFGDPTSGVNNISTLQNPVHTFMNPGNYDVRLIAKNAYQCSDTINKPITINANPVAEFSADTVCKGNLMTFTDHSTPAGSISAWSWSFGDGVTSNAQNPTHLYASAGTYTVTLNVVTGLGCQHTISHQVLVKVPPVAMFTSADLCKGTLTHFTDLSYTTVGTINEWDWDFGDGSFSTDQNPSHLYAAAGPYNVKLVVTNTGGCSDSVTIPVTIMQSPTAKFSYFSSNCPAGKVSFTDHSTPAGSQVTGWNWILTPTVFSSEQNPTYTYSVQNTSYPVSLIIHDMNGCYDTIDSTIFVRPGFAFTFNATTNCLGDSTHFQPVNLAPGDSLHDLQWTFGEAGSAPYNTSSLYEPSHRYANSGSYIVKLKAFNSDNCSDSVFKEVVVHPTPSAAFSFVTQPCNMVVDFNSNATPGSGSIVKWEWDWGDTKPPVIITPPLNGDTTHLFDAEVTYHVKLIVTNSNGCTDSIVKDVSVTCITSAFTLINSFNCSSDSIAFRDLSGPVNKITSWHWDFGDLKPPLDYTTHRDTVRHKFVPGTYLVTLTTQTVAGGNIVSASHTLSVTVNAAPVADFTSDQVCFGDSTRFIDLAQDNQVPITFREWRFGDGSSVVFPDTIIHPVHKYLLPGVYSGKFMVTNTIGCRDSIIKQVVVHKLPVAAFTSSPPCQRYDIRFADGSTKGDTTMKTWWWNFNDPHHPYDTVQGQIAWHRFDSVGLYPVYFKVMDKNGCIDDTSYTGFAVKQSPIAAFTITENVGDRQGVIHFNNESSDDAKAFKWSFGNGKGSTEVNPTVTYVSDKNPYTVELVTWNDGLCYDTTSMTYEFLFDNLYVPNAFSPSNLSATTGCRVFQPKGLNLTDYHAMVFDKWGHLIWESRKLDCQDPAVPDCKGSPVEFWDGTFNGEPMPQDVYMWKINATFINGKVWEGSEAGTGSTTTMGTVTLIR